MSLTPEKARGRAQKAARARWHGDRAEVTPEITQLEAEQCGQAVAVLKASWRSATAEQKDQLRRLWNQPAPRGTGTG
jgi:hypothetical protein